MCVWPFFSRRSRWRPGRFLSFQKIGKITAGTLLEHSEGAVRETHSFSVNYFHFYAVFFLKIGQNNKYVPLSLVLVSPVWKSHKSSTVDHHCC